MKKKFVTMFEKAENIHLIKDVGQIPYLMSKYFNYNSYLITYKNDTSYEYLNEEVKNLRLEFISKIKLGRYSLSMLWYILLNAKKIDVLNLYHHRDKTYLNLLLYKTINPKGIAFLKSDIGLKSIQEDNNFYPKTTKYFIRNWLFKKLLPKIDIISIESKVGFEIISNEVYPQYRNKFLYLPNGININKMYSLVKPKQFNKKENLIITVGRIGAIEKNNELLLDAIEKIKLENWKIAFIGPIERDFKIKITNFFKRNPKLKKNIIFTGAIYNRVELFQWYSKSKIFCLTSFAEGSPLVFPEALAYGNYLITTNISGAIQSTNNEKFGKVIEQNNLHKLIEALNEAISSDNFPNTDEFVKFTRDNFNWKSILLSLEKRISTLQKD